MSHCAQPNPCPGYLGWGDCACGREVLAALAGGTELGGTEGGTPQGAGGQAS